MQLHRGVDDAGKSSPVDVAKWKETVVTKYHGTGTGKVIDVGPARHKTTGEYLGEQVTISYTRDGSTWTSTTMHHKNILVKKGQEIAPGTDIAIGAGYGEQFGKPNAGDPHVHWSLQRDGVPVHPLNGAPLVTPKR